MELHIEKALQQGIAAHKEGRLQDAERFYRTILRAKPEHSHANHNLGVLAVAVGKPAEAIPFFKLALEVGPNIEQFWLSYIDALVKTEKFDDARRVLADAQQAGIAMAKLQTFEGRLQSERSSGGGISHQKLGNTLQSHQDELSPAIELREVGKYKEAQEWLSNFIEHDSKNVEALSLLSQVLLLDKKEAEAERVLTEAASIDSELPSVYRNQARLLLKQSRAAEALDRAHLGCKRSPEEFESLMVLAACLVANQRDLEARPLIEKILKAEPDYAEAYATRALIKLREKDPSGAIKDVETTVSLKPHLTQMWQLLSSLHYQANNLSGAIEALRSALKNESKNANIMAQLGEFLRQNNEAGEAINILEVATKLAPEDAKAWANLGVALQQEKRKADAKIAYEKALALDPESAAVSSNLGAIAGEAEDWESALQYFERALEIQPNLAEAHSNLGGVLKELGRLHEALSSYNQAKALKPDSAELHNNLGVTLYELGRLGEAEASYERAIALKPDFAEAHSNLGTTRQEFGRLDEAEASHRTAIALKSDYANAYLNLCELLEKTNAIDKLETVLEEARTRTNDKEADFLFYKAVAAFRRECYAEADTFVSQIAEDEVSVKREALFYKLKGDLCDRKQDYDTALLAYERSNQAVKAGLAYQSLEIEANYYFESYKNAARQLEQLSLRSPFVRRPSQNGRQPTFLVGFPRSGTTLLDTILRTHSRIAVIEEQPMVFKMNVALGEPEDVSVIEAMDNGRLRVASNAYLDELSKHTNWPEDSLVVDKLPLNLMKAPLITQVFPEGKFILALRHPFDCILSCWMQNFKLNPAMANMVDLDRIVDFYCVAMKIFKLSQKRYGLNVHRIRYEDLVEDFETETAGVLRFLDLEWETELVNYQATAKARPAINTPSHSQVIKPIYKTASYRWRHYEKRLEKYRSQLAPWLQEYGY